MGSTRREFRSAAGVCAGAGFVCGELFAYISHRVTDRLRGLGLVKDDWSSWYRVLERALDEKATKDYEAGGTYVQWLRQNLNRLGLGQRPLLALADGSFDKVEFWNHLPAQTWTLVRTAFSLFCPRHPPFGLKLSLFSTLFTPHSPPLLFLPPKKCQLQGRAPGDVRLCLTPR